MTSVREALFNLAVAFSDARRNEESLAALERCAAEDGEVPSAVQVALERGRLLEATDLVSALGAYLSVGEDVAAIRSARLCLDRVLANDALTELPAPMVARILELPAGQPATDLLVAALGVSQHRAQLALDRLGRLDRFGGDDLQRAAELRATALLDLQDYNRLLDSDIGVEPPSPALRTIRARGLLEIGAFDDVVAHLEPLTNPSPEVTSILALAICGLGRRDEALALLGDFDDSAHPDLLLARTATLLSIPSPAYMVDESTPPYQEARDAASAALRQRPRSLNALVLRAQASLEGHSIEEGRRLLESAREQLCSRRTTLRWLLAQERVRADQNRFQFSRAVIADICGDLTIEAVREVGRITTSAQQDGHLDDLDARLASSLRPLEAERLLAANDRVGAAAAFDDAAAAFGRLADAAAEPDRPSYLDQQRQLLHRALSTVPTAPRAGAYGTFIFDTSYRPEPPPTGWEPIRSDVEGALTLLCATMDDSADPAVLAGSIRIAAQLRIRLADPEFNPDGDASMPAFRWAALGTATNPTDGMLLAMTSMVFSALDADRAAQQIADRAYAENSWSPYVRSAVTIARVNELGPDADVSDLQNDGDEAWWRQVELHRALRDADREGLRAALDAVDADGPATASWDLVNRTLARSVLERRPVPATLVDEARAMAADPSDLLRACSAAILAGDAERAASLLEEVGRTEQPRRSHSQLRLAISAMRRPGRTVDDVLAVYLDEATSCSDIREFQHVRLTLLPLALGGDAIDPETWRHRCERKLEEIEHEAAAILAERAVPGTGLWVELAGADVTPENLSRLLHAATADDTVDDDLRVACRAWSAVHDDVVASARRSEVLAAAARGAAIDGAAYLDGLGLTPRGRFVASLVGGSAVDIDLDDADAAQIGRELAEQALAASDGERDGWWVLYGRFAEMKSASRAGQVALDAVAATMESTFVEQLTEGLGPASTLERSHVSVILGNAFVPDDTSTERWELFTHFLKALKDRIESESGFNDYGFAIRGDRRRSPACVRLLINEGVVENHNDLSNGNAVLRSASTHPDGAPLRVESVMNVIEAFTRANIDRVINVFAVTTSLAAAGVVDRSEILRDAATTCAWLDAMRAIAAQWTEDSFAHLSREVARQLGSATEPTSVEELEGSP